MRSLVLSNGSLLVTLDCRGEVRDVYFPHVGLENHAGGALRHRIGVYVDNAISWLSEDPHWQIRVECVEDALQSTIEARNDTLALSISFTDVVYNERPIFVRAVTLVNHADRARTVKLFFGQEFELSRSYGSDTAYFDPQSHAILHYKGQRVLLANGSADGAPFSDYAVGLFGVDGKDGTFRDAEDGTLSKNAIEHGSVDSIIGFTLSLASEKPKTLHYWLTAATSIKDALELNAYVHHKTPQHLVESTRDYWRAWTNRYEWHFQDLSPDAIALFKKSLMFVRAHADNGGGILASADGETLEYGKDTYAYVWPRDASYGALALARVGDIAVAERYFTFCKDVLTEGGYLLHKHLPDQSLGSSWHPWIRDGEVQLPIQEDETALVLWSIAQHYRRNRDLEFIEQFYNPLVASMADFLCRYRDETGLPHASYDLWEEKHGISTFTSAAVHGALRAAAEIARVLGKEHDALRYDRAAHEIKAAIQKHLVTEDPVGWVKLIETFEQKTVYDRTVDISSVYGLFAFGVLEPDDPQLSKAFEETVSRLSRGGGIARYDGDPYYRRGLASNPWYVTTLWYAQYLTARAKTLDELAPVRNLFEWVVQHAQYSGTLSEQLYAEDLMQCSVAPLTWSHAAYVNAVLDYLEKHAALRGVPDGDLQGA